MNERRTLHFPIYLSTGVQMWQENPSENVVTTLNHYGLHHGKKATRGHVDRLGASHDRQLLEWKTSNEVSVSQHTLQLNWYEIMCFCSASVNKYLCLIREAYTFIYVSQSIKSKFCTTLQPKRLRNISYIWKILCDIFQRSHLLFSILENRHIYIFFLKMTHTNTSGPSMYWKWMWI